MELPLVTVAVVAYNAVDFVLETLESIKAQTYTNIELVVADDASPDGTASVCKEWIGKNKDRFVSAILIESKSNGGVVVNSNRALSVSHGEWFKIIGSDDVLFPDAIEKMVSYAKDNTDASFMFGDQLYFNDSLENKQSYKFGRFGLKRSCCGPNVSAKEQYNILTKMFFGCAAASFGKTKMLKDIGGFDERWHVEDWPLYINITKNGYKIYHIGDVLVYRRIISTSIMNEKESFSILRKHAVKDACGGLDYLYENSNFMWRRFYKLMQWLNYNIVRTGNDKRNWRCQFWHFMAKYFDPYNYFYVWMRIKEKCIKIIG